MYFFLTIKKNPLLLFFIIIYLRISTTIIEKHYKKYILSISKITIKINSSGEQKIFSSSFF